MAKPKLSKKDLLWYLKKLQKSGDTERAHSDADDALLEFIDDPEITKAYEELERWYA